jgi:hypothetical protein
MAYDSKAARALYRKLLGLYPRVFRERFGKSMEQTFNDLCNERRQQTAEGLSGFILWLFVETAVGIAREHILLITGENAMKNVFTSLRAPAFISFILVLPFALLEFSFNTVNKQNAPGLTVLFGLLWLLPTVFIVVLAPLVRNTRAGNRIMANPMTLLLRVAFLTLIAMMWGGIIVDQLPCFLGVPNCD